MKNYILKFLIFLFIIFSHKSRADEGMWFPQLLQQLNGAEMRLKGLQIPMEDIYNINKSSLKDAVVLFGAGCTGEIVSSKGLLLTNYHCGFSQIQNQSSLEHNYLKEGFWAKNQEEEIPCAGLSVTFVVSIVDVTAEFNSLLNDQMSEQKRNDIIIELSAQLEKKAVEGTKYDAKVRQFFSGNEFYMITTQTFKDIRFVGAPPLSLGRFGGDTDNWSWPSHTADFSLFRIYADKENNPASYNSNNIPYKPKYKFSINVGGVQQDDFTMVYGFPGKTQEYISSYAVELLLNVTNPNRVSILEERLRIIDQAMRSSEAIHLQYAAKQSSISNRWKKWRGETKGLKLANAIQLKREFEYNFQQWADKDPMRKSKYGSILSSFQNIYTSRLPYLDANDYYAEAIFGIELLNYAKAFQPLVLLSSSENPDKEKIVEEVNKLKSGIDGYFKNYHVPTDKSQMISLFRIFDQHINDTLKPAYFTDLRNRYNGDFEKMADIIYSKSLFVSKDKTENLLTDFTGSSLKKLKGDPGFLLAENLWNFYKGKIAEQSTYVVNEAARLQRIFMQGQREMQPEKKFYPDANSTLRIAYGQVRGYSPRDGIYYEFQTTMKGMIEKYIPGDEEFDLPQKIIDLYAAKDFGRYGVNGEMPVTFIATNHTTGGNSGSPVLNARGQLIGTNYDRVWEGTMSDVKFNPEVCRNITLDIRFTLFIIDKFAGAKNLIEEMDIIN